MTDLVLIKKINEHTVEVSLNRPDKLNALTKPMWKKLGTTFRDFAKKKISIYAASLLEVQAVNLFHQVMILVNLKNLGPIANKLKSTEYFCMELYLQFKNAQFQPLH